MVVIEGSNVVATISTENIRAMSVDGDIGEVFICVNIPSKMAGDLLIECMEADKVQSFEVTERDKEGDASGWIADMQKH